MRWFWTQSVFEEENFRFDVVLTKETRAVVAFGHRLFACPMYVLCNIGTPLIQRLVDQSIELNPLWLSISWHLNIFLWKKDYWRLRVSVLKRFRFRYFVFDSMGSSRTLKHSCAGYCWISPRTSLPMINYSSLLSQPLVSLHTLDPSD